MYMHYMYLIIGLNFILYTSLLVISYKLSEVWERIHQSTCTLQTYSVIIVAFTILFLVAVKIFVLSGFLLYYIEAGVYWYG